MITIAAQTLSFWTYGGSTATLRIYSDSDFIAASGAIVSLGNVSTEECYKSVTCTVAGTTLTIPSFTIDATTDSSQPRARYIAYLHDSDGVRQYLWLQKAFRVSHLISSTTWTNIDAFNRAVPISRPAREYYDKDQIDRLFQISPSDAVSTTDTRLATDLSDYGGTLSGAVAAIGSTPMILTITESVTVSSPLTIPANITLDFESTGKIIAQANVIIHSMTDPGTRQVFECTTGQVRFADGAVKEMNMAWIVGSDASTVTATQFAAAFGVLLASCNTYGGGTIYIPSGAWTTKGGHTLGDSVTIRGAGQFSSASTLGTTLTLDASPDEVYMFYIGEGENCTYFADLVIAAGASGIGILFRGSSPNTSGAFGFDRVTFDNCQVGVQTDSLSGSWQLAQVNFTNCIFQQCATSIITNSVNQGITLVNTNFAVPASGIAWQNNGCGLVNILGAEFAGAGATSKVMVITAAHGGINFIGCQDENFGTFIQNDASDISGMTNIDKSLVQSKITLNQSCLLSITQSNLMSYAIQGSPSGGYVSVKDCYIREVSVSDGVTVVSPAILSSATGGLIVANQDLPTQGVQTRRLPSKFISSTQLDGSPTTPVVSALSRTSISEEKIQLRIGQMTAAEAPEYYYDIFRSVSARPGRLQFQGNQAGFIGFDFYGDVFASRFTGDIATPAMITSNQNDYSPLSTAMNLRLSTDASRDITGFNIAQTTGQSHYIYNVGAQNIVFKHESASSTAANRILCSTSADLTIAPNGIAQIWYDGTSARWRAYKV